MYWYGEIPRPFREMSVEQMAVRGPAEFCEGVPQTFETAPELRNGRRGIGARARRRTTSTILKHSNNQTRKNYKTKDMRQHPKLSGGGEQLGCPVLQLDLAAEIARVRRWHKGNWPWAHRHMAPPFISLLNHLFVPLYRGYRLWGKLAPFDTANCHTKNSQTKNLWVRIPKSLR